MLVLEKKGTARQLVENLGKPFAPHVVALEHDEARVLRRGLMAHEFGVWQADANKRVCSSSLTGEG